jgi:glycosyltransferase involved in cell wall biosynthesis
MGYPKSKTVVVPNGFDLEQFRPSRRSYEIVRAELGLAPSERIIGLVARYHPMKDHLTFLKAAALVAQREMRVSFLLVGRGVDPSNTQLTAAISNLGITDRVHLLGERADIPRVTAAFDVAVNCSFSEGFPNSIGEAMASGVPCVVTDVGDSKWLVGNTGLVVAAGDHIRLAAACCELIGTSEPERAEYGQRARERIQENFSIRTVVRQYEQLLIERLVPREGQ